LRKENWQQDLANHIKEAQTRKFSVGEFDCVTWTCDWKAIVTGKDEHKLFQDKFKGKYKTPLGAMRLLKKVCGGDLEKLTDDTLESIPLAMAKRGDIMMTQKCLGICDGENSFFLTPDKGLIVVKTLKCDRAWRLE